MANNMLIKLPAVSTEVTIKAEWIAERDALIAEVGQLSEITNPDSFNVGSTLLKKITKASNALEKLRKEITDPFEAAKKMVKQASDKAREPLEAAKEQLQARLNRYAAEQARKQEEERRRIEDQQRAEIEKQEALNRIAQEEFGADGTEIFQPEVPVIKLETEKAKADDVRVLTVLKFEVTDDGAVPRAFLTVDESKIRLWMSERKDELTEKLKQGEDAGKQIVPGVRFYLDTQVVSR